MVAEVQQELRDTIDQELNVEEESELGQIIGSFCGQLGEAYELIQEGFNAQSASSGSGFALDQTSEITATYRNPATFSVDFLDLDLNAGTYAPGTLIVHVTGQPDVRFANSAEVTSPGGVVSAVRMESEEAGPVRAVAGTLTTIAETVVGFNAVAADPDDATIGALEESDTELRIRRVTELYRRGSTSVSAIAQDTRQVLDVVTCTVLENDTMSTNGDGLPPKSIEAVVQGGDAQDIRDQILASKAAGIQAYGSVSGTATDAEGNVHTIAFSRPTDVPIDMQVTFQYLTGTYPDTTTAEDAAKEAIKESFDAYQKVGRDVTPRRYNTPLFLLPGTVNARVLARKGVSAFDDAADITIAARELATLDLADISVTATALDGAP